MTMSLGGTITDGSLLLALPLAVAAGLVSFLSPCVLPLVPGYLAYTTGLSAAEVFDEAPRRRGRLVAGALLFVAGFTVVFVSAGVLLGRLGGFLLENQDTLQRVLGGLTIVLGLSFIGFLPWLQRDVRLDLLPVDCQAERRVVACEQGERSQAGEGLAPSPVPLASVDASRTRATPG